MPQAQSAINGEFPVRRIVLAIASGLFAQHCGGASFVNDGPVKEHRDITR
jgi:hypothetical protein